MSDILKPCEAYVLRASYVKPLPSVRGLSTCVLRVARRRKAATRYAAMPLVGASRLTVDVPDVSLDGFLHVGCPGSTCVRPETGRFLPARLPKVFT